MKKLFLLIVAIFCFSSVGLFASEIQVMYVLGECNVDMRGSGVWQSVTVDMELYEESIIKTGPDGELELEIDGNTVFVGPESTLQMESLLDRATEKRKLKWLRKATRYAKAVGKEDEQWSDMALAGVRGEKTEDEELEWIVDFEDDELARGKEFFDEGKYGEAIKIFGKIIEEKGIGADNGEASYYLGFSLFSSLRYKEALPYLAESVKYRESPFFESAVMTYSFDQYFLRNYREALEGFSSYIKAFPEGELIPYALLMLGKSYKDMGMKREARMYFTRIEKEYRDSDVYMDAVDELKGM